jgi:TolB protein
MSLYKTTPASVEAVRLTTNGSEAINPVLSPDRMRVAFVSTVGENTDIYILDLNTLVTTRVTNARERDAAPSWSPNGQQIVFESFRDGNLEIYIANADGSNQTRLTNDPAGDHTPVWSRVSNEFAFVRNRFGNCYLFEYRWGYRTSSWGNTCHNNYSNNGLHRYGHLGSRGNTASR